MNKKSPLHQITAVATKIIKFAVNHEIFSFHKRNFEKTIIKVRFELLVPVLRDLNSGPIIFKCVPTGLSGFVESSS